VSFPSYLSGCGLSGHFCGNVLALLLADGSVSCDENRRLVVRLRADVDDDH